jgi:hypothetical protein
MRDAIGRFQMFEACGFIDCFSQDPVRERVIKDLQSMLSMAAFGVDNSLSPELARMIGPLPPHESSYSVERIVMTGVVPM